MSQRALARAMGLDSAAVSLMLRGRREMKISEAVEIAQLLGRPADEVMEAAGVSISTAGRSVPIVGVIDGHGEVHQAQAPSGKIPHPGGGLGPDVQAYQCRTAGSDLDYMDGWLLFADAVILPGVSADAVGRLSLCKIRGGIVYLAKPMRGYGRGRWNLSGPAATAENADIEWAQPVLQIQT